MLLTRKIWMVGNIEVRDGFSGNSKRGPWGRKRIGHQPLNRPNSIEEDYK
jgi:hypothetical protein